MKRILGSGILMLFAFAAPLPAAPQRHSPVAPAAHETSAQQLHEALGRNAKLLVIDVRAPAEYARGHIPEAVNIPLDALPAQIRKMDVPKSTTIVTMCDRGGRSSRAALELQKMGYQTASFCRIDDWRKEGYKIQKGGEKPASK